MPPVPDVTPGAAAPPRPGRLVLVGTGHVFRLAETVKGAVGHYRPNVVGVELDRARLEGLLARARGEPLHAKPGLVHRKLQAFQEGMAGMYGAEAGNEMVAAVQAARETGARLLLLDVPVDRLLKRTARELTAREWLRFAGQGVAGVGRAAWNAVLPRSRRADARARVEAQIAEYQDDPERMMAELRRTFPTVHRIVIRERDERMARLAREQVLAGRDTLCVVGDGHLVGMLPLLADLAPVVHRLGDVRAGRVPQAPTQVAAVGTGASVTFGVQAGVPPPPLDG